MRAAAALAMSAITLAALAVGAGCGLSTRSPAPAQAPPAAAMPAQEEPPAAPDPAVPPGGLPPEMNCWPAPTVAGLWRPVPVERFAGIDATWTLNAIFERLGPAHSELGSGLYIFDWVATDGRRFMVSSSSRCGVVRKAGWVP